MHFSFKVHDFCVNCDPVHSFADYENHMNNNAQQTQLFVTCSLTVVDRPALLKIGLMLLWGIFHKREIWKLPIIVVIFF